MLIFKMEIGRKFGGKVEIVGNCWKTEEHVNLHRCADNSKGVNLIEMILIRSTIKKEAMGDTRCAQDALSQPDVRGSTFMWVIDKCVRG